MESNKNINIKYSSEVVIKCWKDYFYKEHIKEIIINLIVISAAIIIYFCSEFIVLAGLIIFFCFLYLVFIFHFYYNSPLGRIEKNKKSYDEMVIVLSEDEIKLIGSISESKAKWELYEKVFRGRDYYMLFSKSKNCLLIPEEGFETKRDKEWFKNKLDNIGIMEK